MTKRPPLTADECFHPETKQEGEAAAFFSVEGSPLSPRYESVLLGRTFSGQTRVVDFSAPTAQGLIDAMAEAGWEPGRREEVAELCESAGRSQPIVTDKRFGRDIDRLDHSETH